MALSNLFGWTIKKEAAAVCGTACGAGDRPEEPSAACDTACGAGDQPEGPSVACGTACGAGDRWDGTGNYFRRADLSAGDLCRAIRFCRFFTAAEFWRIFYQNMRKILVQRREIFLLPGFHEKLRIS